MEQRGDGLWRGGQWEQPAPVFPQPPEVRIPPRAMTPRRSILRPRRRRAVWPVVLAVVLALAVLCMAGWLLQDRFGGAVFRGGAIWEPDLWQEETDYSTDPPSIPQKATGTGVTVTLAPPAGEALTFAQIYEKNAPSMVSILSTGAEEYAMGTGIILTGDGYLVTNAHIVAGGREVEVYLSDGRVLEAGLVGFDAGEDLAVLKVEAEDLLPAEFGDSLELKIGDRVAALGDPLGYRSTLTEGIVSALDREVDMDGAAMVLIQTSAAINYGNSGGALLNEYGQVVGITTIKIVSDDGSAEGLGFAIPSRRVKYVADALIDGREVKTGVFGVTVYTIPAEGGGLELMEVDRRSDAWTQGLREGDVIAAVNGKPVSGTQDLSRVKQDLGPGDVVELTCRRDGETFTVEVALVDAELIR